jgi:hypothetical protein
MLFERPQQQPLRLLILLLIWQVLDLFELSKVYLWLFILTWLSHKLISPVLSLQPTPKLLSPFELSLQPTFKPSIF